MSIIDVPFSWPLPVLNGKASIKTSLAALLAILDQPALPRCTAIEVLYVRVLDPNGVPFATMGTYLP